MTFQEILDGITRHRANPIKPSLIEANLVGEFIRKVDEIEWALQAIAETCRDRDFGEGMLTALKRGLEKLEK